MSENICAGCKNADECRIRRGLQTQTAMSGGMSGLVEVATIREVVVDCKKFEKW